MSFIPTLPRATRALLTSSRGPIAPRAVPSLRPSHLARYSTEPIKPIEPTPIPTAVPTPQPAPGHADGQSHQDKQAKNAVGPFTLRAAAVFAVTGAGLYFYFQSEKAAVAARKAAETATAKIGRPKVGGPFVLQDQNGNNFSDKDLVGKWSLVYFGFTNCPDICPEELDKMGLVVDEIANKYKVKIQPVFITCDPARDDTKSVKTYVKDFHPDLVGLTGTYDDIKKCCKAYRVYFSTPPNATAADDYLVDHSIFFYLMDPNGEFVDAFGRSMGAEETSAKVADFICRWSRAGNKPVWKDSQL